MTDHADLQPPRSGGRLDPLQILFWISVTVGVGAAGIAITAGPSVGQAGAVLLVLLNVHRREPLGLRAYRRPSSPPT
jgi:hypothetical protein